MNRFLAPLLASLVCLLAAAVPGVASAQEGQILWPGPCLDVVESGDTWCPPEPCLHVADTTTQCPDPCPIYAEEAFDVADSSLIWCPPDPCPVLDDASEELCPEPCLEALTVMPVLCPLPDTPPTVQLADPGTRRGTIELTATAYDDVGVVSVEFFLDGADGRTLGTDTDGSDGWSATLDTTELDDGPVVVGARARDLADEAVDRADLVVDNTGPTVTIGGLPEDGRTAATSQRFPLTVTDALSPVASAACALGSAPFAPCSGGLTSHTLTGLADGSHTLRVQATDALGNTSSVVTRTFTVDTTPPQTTITAGPANGLRSTATAHTFRFASGEDDARFECRFWMRRRASPPWQACTSPVAVSGLARGTYYFHVRAVDAVQNADPTPARRFFVVLAPKVATNTRRAPAPAFTPGATGTSR